jgi:hypothetical protein
MSHHDVMLAVLDDVVDAIHHAAHHQNASDKCAFRHVSQHMLIDHDSLLCAEHDLVKSGYKKGDPHVSEDFPNRFSESPNPHGVNQNANP